MYCVIYTNKSILGRAKLLNQHAHVHRIPLRGPLWPGQGPRPSRRWDAVRCRWSPACRSRGLISEDVRDVA